MKPGYLVALTMLIFGVSSATSSGADDVVIENHGKRTFYYSLRERDGAAWSRTYEVAEGEKQSHTTSSRLQISYLSDTAHFAWLEPSQTYGIDNIVQGQLRAATQVRRPAIPEAASSAANSSAAAGEADLPAPATGTEPDRAAPTATADPTGTDPTGTDPTGTDPTGTDPTGTDPTGADSTGADSTGADPTGADSTGADPTEASPSVTAGAADPAPGGTDNRSADTLEGIFDITNRVVTVQAIADTTYREAFPEWRERIQRIVEGASKYFQREYSIRLVLTGTRQWQYDGVADDLETRWARLLEQSPHEVDLIVAMVGYGDYSSVQGEAAYTGQLGRAAFFGQHLMAADRKDYHENRAKTVLIHELGHVFGAFHVADRNLMMYPGYLQLPTEEIIAGTVPFGETIDMVFNMTKEFNFREGIESLSPVVQRKIQALFRSHGLAQELSQVDPVTAGYKYREQRAKIVAAQMAARAEASREAFDGLSE